MKNKHVLSKIVSLSVAFALTLALALPCVLGLGEVEVAKASGGKVADVFMIAGQSNAAGSTKKTATPSGTEYAYPQKQNVLYYGETHRTTGNGQAYSYKKFNLEPVQHGCGYSVNHVGFELGMANKLNDLPEYQGPDRKAIIFKSAAGGTSVFPETMSEPDKYGNWYPPSLWEQDYYDGMFNYHTGLQYRAFMDNLTNLVALLKEEGYTEINVKGVFWMQGCSDRGRCDAYKTIVKVLIEDMRNDIGEIVGYDCTDMPFYIGEISETFSSAIESVVEYNREMIETQHKIASEMKNVFVAEIKHYKINDLDRGGNNITLGSDSAHYNYEDIVAIGEDFTDLYFDTFGKFNDYVDIEVDQSAVTIKDLYSLNFTGKYGGNYSAGITEEIDFELTVTNVQKLVALTVSNATLTEQGMRYKEGTSNKIYSYKITDIGENVTINATLEQNKSYLVKVTCSDQTYGNKPNDKYVLPAYGGCRYILKTYPETYGAVEKFIINGTEVPGAVGVHDFLFDDLEQYVTEESGRTINIEIVYGEYNAVKDKLENAGKPEDNPPESSDGGSGCGATSAVSLAGLIALCLGGMLILRRR